jgi:1-acyl-sn-glycerol-3-phosphate acyltransferase
MWHPIWYFFCRQMTMFALVTFFGFRARWRERLPRTGGVLLVSNHQSYLDPPIATVALRRPVAFMARRSLFRNPVFGRLIHSLNAFPINREGRDTQAMREALRRLRGGEVLLVFPEGTRTRDGRVGSMRGGVSLLAKRAGVAVTPMAVDGAFEAMPRDGGGFRFVRLTAGYGRTIPAEEVARLSKEALQERVRDEIVRVLRELRDRRTAG